MGRADDGASPAQGDPGLVRAPTLHAIRGALIATVIPNLPEGDAATVGHLILRLVDHLVATDGAAGAEATEAAERQFVELVLDGGAAATATLRRLVDAEFQQIIKQDPEAAGGIAQLYSGGRTSRAEEDSGEKEHKPELTADSLTAYLQKRFTDRPSRVVRALHLLPGGMSKQTIKVMTEEAGRPQSFVIRKDFKITPSKVSVIDEFPMLREMWLTGGMPMAEPLWEEADPSVFGTPLIAVALVEGSNDYRPALQDREVARTFADALAGAMARLHAMPLQQTTAGPLVARDGRAHVAAEIDRWHAILRQSKLRPEPVLEAAFAWLRANIPDLRAPPAIVHGDIGFHNMLMKDGRLRALLDWEFTHIGDPIEDVVYARFFVEQVIDWETFLDLYEAHGGIRPSPEQERFYAVWQSARNAAGCAGAERAFVKNPGADLKLGVSGMTFKPRFALDALQRIVS